MSASEGDVKGVASALSRGADVFAREAGGGTVLHTAAWGGHADVIRELVTSGGAELDPQDGRGNTAAHIAAFRNQLASVEALLEVGSRFDLKNAAGQLPIDAARESGNVHLVELLRAN